MQVQAKVEVLDRMSVKLSTPKADRVKVFPEGKQHANTNANALIYI